MIVKVTAHGAVVAVVPKGMRGGFSHGYSFAKERESWVKRAKSKVALLNLKPIDAKDPAPYKIAFLRSKIGALVERFGSMLGIVPKSVGERKMSSIWGVCRQSGKITFNIYLALLPERVLEYVVAHEMCHLVEFNHSGRFWKSVGSLIPDYAERRRELRSYVLPKRYSKK